MTPPLVVQRTAGSAAFVTVAVKLRVARASTAMVAGVMLMATDATITVAEAERRASAVLVAVMVYDPPTTGAIHVTLAPLPLIWPPVAVHETAVLVALPTLAEKVCVEPALTFADVGVTLTEMGGGGGATGSPPPPPQALKTIAQTIMLADSARDGTQSDMADLGVVK